MKTIIVDSHNEVLPYWFEEYLLHKRPLVVVRIDQHHDMNQECPVLPAREGRPLFDYVKKIMPHISEYAKRKLNEGNFTCPAFHYGIVGALYHLNPRVNTIDAYGRVLNGEIRDSPKTKKKCTLTGFDRTDLIVWDSGLTRLRSHCGKAVPVPQSLSLEDFKRDLAEGQFPKVICLDLDGLYGMDDKGPTEDVLAKRVERVLAVLECVLSPALACIARSQTPRAYVPPELVDCLQDIALQLVELKRIRHLSSAP